MGERGRHDVSLPHVGALGGCAALARPSADNALWVEGRLERQSKPGEKWAVYHRGSDVALASTRCGSDKDTSNSENYQISVVHTSG
ncbi:MAG: hypothetical protein V3U46_12085 [Acidimicrobiia bacterium]